jgi:hypothetical protein
MSCLDDPRTSNDNLFHNVKSDIRGFSNISGILEKVHYDENFTKLSKMFVDIFDFETVYAFTGVLMRAEEASRA